MFIDSVKKDHKLSALVNEAYKQTKGLHVIESRHLCYSFNGNCSGHMPIVPCLTPRCSSNFAKKVDFIFLSATHTFSSRFDNFGVLLDAFFSVVCVIRTSPMCA